MQRDAIRECDEEEKEQQRCRECPGFAFEWDPGGRREPHTAERSETQQPLDDHDAERSRPLAHLASHVPYAIDVSEDCARKHQVEETGDDQRSKQAREADIDARCAKKQ